MSLKEDLSEKIDTEEKYKTLCLNHGISFRRNLFSFAGAGSSVSSHWWAAREKARTTYGVYETSSVIDRLNDNVFMFLHVSLQDRTMVAYTPDARAGESDRQLQTSLGRFLVKFFPVLSDEYIQELVATHLAEISTEVEYVTGAENLKAAYLNGVHSCMAKEFPGLPCHPVEAYDVPQLSLAVLRDKAGKINARALVFDGPKGKVYIRAYGDTKLVKRLERQGVQQGTLEGVKLKVLPTSNENQFVTPYLDGGATALARIDNELVVVSSTTRAGIYSLNPRAVTTSTGASGVTTLENMDSTGFTCYDYLTGEVINRLVDSTVVVLHGGVLRRIKTCNSPQMKLAKSNNGGSWEEVLCFDETFFVPEYPYSYSSRLWVENEQTRQALGFVRLSAFHYPESQEWVRNGYRTSEYVATPEGFVKLADAVEVVSANGSAAYAHKSAKQKAWVQLHANTRGVKAFASDPSSVVRTRSGRKVVVAYNEVYEMWDSTYDFQRNAVYLNVLGMTFYKGRNERVDMSPGSELFNRAMDAVLSGYKQLEKGVANLIDALGAEVAIPVDGYRRYLSHQDPAMVVKHFPVFITAVLDRGAHDPRVAAVFDYYYKKKAEMQAESYDNAGNLTTTKVPTPEQTLVELTATISQDHDQTTETPHVEIYRTLPTLTVLPTTAAPSVPTLEGSTTYDF